MRYQVLILCLAARLLAHDKVPAALLTGLEGEVTILRPPATDPVTARILEELFPGDRVKTGTEGSATILYQDGKIVAINKNSSVDIPAALPDSDRGGRSIEENELALDHPGRLLALIAEGEKIAANLAVRGKEDSLSLAVYEPGNTALMDGKPRFVWSLFTDAQSYLVKIQRMGSDVWSAITVDTVLPYPENKPGLDAGTYLVRIAALTSDNETLDVIDRTVRVLSPEQADTVQGSVRRVLEQKPDSFTCHLLAAKIYECRNLRFDAIREYGALLRARPDLPFIHLALSILLKDNGQVRRANVYYDRWKELTSSGK